MISTTQPSPPTYEESLWVPTLQEVLRVHSLTRILRNASF